VGKRGGVMLAQEGDRWTVTLIQHFGSPAPEEVPGFIEFARSLPAPYIYEVVRQAEPIGEAVVARFPFSMRRRYEHLRRFPEGYLVIGDAISSFNPLYGQGMSAASQQAMQLKAALAAGDAELARRFFRLAAKVVDGPWTTSAGGDLRIPETIGPRPLPARIVNWYIGKLQRAAHHDPELAMRFLRVTNLLDSPPTVLRPSIVGRVIRSSFRSGSGTAETGVSASASSAAR